MTYYIVSVWGDVKSVPPTNLLVTDSIEKATVFIKEVSEKWIVDEVGRNNYNETLENISKEIITQQHISENRIIPDGIVRVWSDPGPVGIVDMITVYKKKTAAGLLYGFSSTVTILRHYIITKVDDIDIVQFNSKDTSTSSIRYNKCKSSPSSKSLQLRNPKFIDELKAFKFDTLTPVTTSPRGKNVKEEVKEEAQVVDAIPEAPAVPAEWIEKERLKEHAMKEELIVFSTNLYQV